MTKDDHKQIFIYPQWLKAKRDLAESLGLNDKQFLILTDWFRNHAFEIGVDYNYREEDLKRSFVDIEKHSFHFAARELAEMILEHGTYMRETTKHLYDTTTIRTTVLIFGCPPLGVGKGKRIE